MMFSSRYGKNLRKCKKNTYGIIKNWKGVKMLMEINLFGWSNILPSLFILIKSSALITSMANICLLIGMLYVYMERYLKVKSKFTTTLVLFSLLFLVQNILFSVYLIYNPPETINSSVFPLIFLGLEFIALALLINDNKGINTLFFLFLI